MTESISDCPICKNGRLNSIEEKGLKTYFDCKRCGKYEATSSLIAVLNKNTFDLAGLSAYIRNSQSENVPQIDTYNYKQLNENNINYSHGHKVDLFLDYLYKNQSDPGIPIEIDVTKDYPLFYCKSYKELSFYIRSVKSLDLIYFGDATDNAVIKKIGLTIKGFDKVFSNRDIQSNQCFVAMSFEEDYKKVYEEGILYAFKNSLDKRVQEIEPVLIENNHFNGRIDDEIIAQIKRSKFLIADLTHNNHNVYYESGFAHGYKLPVIYICKESFFEQSKKISESKDPKKIKFDVDHFNIIVYKDTTDLGKALVARVLHTIIK